MSSALRSPIHNDSLADVLERVLDKGIVIAGDVVVSLVGIELLSIKVRLLITTVDKAIEMGINWWEMDPSLSVAARDAEAALKQQQAAGAALPMSANGQMSATGQMSAAAQMGAALPMDAAPAMAAELPPSQVIEARADEITRLEEDRARLSETNRELRGRLAMMERRIADLEK